MKKIKTYSSQDIVDITGEIDFSSWFYRNCKIQRRRGSKCCNSCPFRKGIEVAEKERLGNE